jgi:hypothetical protein
MPVGQLARGLIRAALTGYFIGYTYACIINGTPMITRLGNDECPHAWYMRDELGEWGFRDRGKLEEYLGCRLVEVFDWGRLWRIRFEHGSWAGTVEVFASATGRMLTADDIAELLDRGFIVSRGYNPKVGEFMYIALPLGGYSNVEYLAGLLARRMPSLEYYVADPSGIEGRLIMSIINSGDVKGVVYLCRGGVVAQLNDGGEYDCVPVLYDVHGLDEGAVWDFRMAGVNVSDFINRFDWVKAEWVSINNGSAAAYALRAEDSVHSAIVPVSTSSLRRVIIGSMRALSGGSGEVDLLGEAGLA